MAKIDWRKAPPGTRWWAVDVSGKPRWYRSPDVPDYLPPWQNGPIDAPSFGFEGHWKDSLVERPLTGQKKRRRASSKNPQRAKHPIASVFH